MARNLLLKHQSQGEGAMRVDSIQGVMPSQLQSASNGENADGFRSVLESAKQNLAQTQNGESSKSASLASTKTAAQELEAFLRKSPIQRMRDAILKEMGLTEEDLKHMPPDKRAAIEDAIADRIKKKLLGESKDNVFSAGVSGDVHGFSVARGTPDVSFTSLNSSGAKHT